MYIANITLKNAGRVPYQLMSKMYWLLLQWSGEDERLILPPVPIYSWYWCEKCFWGRFWGHLMARIAIQNNPMIRLTAIGLKDNSSGVAATGSLTLNGTATGAGVIKAMIGGGICHFSGKIEPLRLATRIKCGDQRGVNTSVTASVSTATLTLTAKCKGEIGNEIELSVQSTARHFSGSQCLCVGFAKCRSCPLHLPVWCRLALSHYHLAVCWW